MLLCSNTWTGFWLDEPTTCWRSTREQTSATLASPTVGGETHQMPSKWVHFLMFIWIWVWRVTVQAVQVWATASSSSGWETESFPSQTRVIISLASPGSTLGLVKYAQNTSPGKHPSQIPKQTLTGYFWMTKLIIFCLRMSPATHWRKLISASCICDLILLVTARARDCRWG